MGKFSTAIGGHCSGTPGLAQALKNALKLGQTGRVVGPRGPRGADARDGEGRVDGQTGLDCGLRLIDSVKLSEGGGQMKNRQGIISVGVD